MNIVITGSSGLIGSEAVTYFDQQGHRTLGVDNNMRAYFFGPGGDTRWNLTRLRNSTRHFQYFDIDLRNRNAILEFFREHKIDGVIHCAAQPSHDLAKKLPFEDFDVNAVGTLNLLEATRRYATDAPFLLMSTNKVYGDAPNEVPLIELEHRWDYARAEDFDGIDESCRIDQSKHSLFGASKAAADVMTQEYGRYFGMPTVCFRAGCVTGPNHSGVELHGFLSYLIKVAVSGQKYLIYGYKGKQVRDQIHSLDVVRAFEAYIEDPSPGEVYNLGGGRGNSASILECFSKVEQLTRRKINYAYFDQNREGDHICYITNLAKLKWRYPKWSITKSLDEIVCEMVKEELERNGLAVPKTVWVHHSPSNERSFSRISK